MSAGVIQFNKRILHANPLEPYSWAAEYPPTKGGRGRPVVFKQFSASTGYHYAREIDRLRLKRLVILGHPHSPIYCNPISSLGPPDEVLIGAHNFMQMENGIIDPKSGLSGWKDKVSIPYFGFRYGADQYLTEIMPDQTVHKVLIENGVETVRGKLEG
jgi:hypothetical protein